MRKKWIKQELVNIITVEAGKAVVGTEMKSQVGTGMTSQTFNNYGHKYSHASKTWNASGLIHFKNTKTAHEISRKISGPFPIGTTNPVTIHFTNTPASKQSGPS